MAVNRHESAMPQLGFVSVRFHCKKRHSVSWPHLNLNSLNMFCVLQWESSRTRVSISTTDADRCPFKMGWDDGIEDLRLVRAQNLLVESLEITSLGMSQIFGPSWIYHIAVDDLPLLKLCHGPWAKVGQIGSDQNWWICSNMITEMGCWSPMTSILSYSSKGWLNHQITLMASCRDEERLANYWDAGWKQINWRYHLQSPKSHHFSNQTNKSKQIETDQNRKNVWSVIPFQLLQLPFSLDFLHVALATLAPMLIQISTVGSTSAWSLQLDLPSVASVGDPPWRHGDFMGILR